MSFERGETTGMVLWAMRREMVNRAAWYICNILVTPLTLPFSMVYCVGRCSFWPTSVSSAEKGLLTELTCQMKQIQERDFDGNEEAREVLNVLNDILNSVNLPGYDDNARPDPPYDRAAPYRHCLEEVCSNIKARVDLINDREKKDQESTITKQPSSAAPVGQVAASAPKPPRQGANPVALPIISLTTVFTQPQAAAQPTTTAMVNNGTTEITPLLGS